MMKKTVLALACSLLVVPLVPSVGECHHAHGGDALVWGITGLLVGSTLASVSYRPPPEVVYTAPPPPAYPPPAYSYSYAPPAPVETCRWERPVLDGYGRVMLDGYGRPMREYTVGPCNAPPY
ncbi:MAG: hypothetical protein PHI97_13030 [Desulfobulbus sp.]|nr:hypothetical protein [Desulfobulbus sp.]